MASFWALEVRPGKVHNTELDFDLHLRQAALGATAKAGERVILSVHTDNKAFVLGSLRVEHCEQIPLDLHFRAGEELGFSVSGSSSVHLTGNVIPDIASDDEDFADSDEGGHNRAKLRAQLREYLGDEASEGEEKSHSASSEDEGESLGESEELSPLPQKRKAQDAPKAKAPEGSKPAAAPKQDKKPVAAQPYGEKQKPVSTLNKQGGEKQQAKPAGTPKQGGGQKPAAAGTPKQGGGDKQGQKPAATGTAKQGGSDKQGQKPAAAGTPKQGGGDKPKNATPQPNRPAAAAAAAAGTPKQSEKQKVPPQGGNNTPAGSNKKKKPEAKPVGFSDESAE